MKSERDKLVTDIRAHLVQMAPHQAKRRTADLLKQAADCIEQLEGELNRVHENLHPGF